MPVRLYTARNYTIRYDGTNSAAIVAALPSSFNMFQVEKHATLVSETNGVLTLTYGSSDLGDVVINEGDWVCWQDNSSGAAAISDTDFHRVNVLLPD